jgi:hypothetical protein
MGRPEGEHRSAKHEGSSVTTNCSVTNAVDASMAHAMKRDEPRRAMTPPAPTRYVA